MLVAMERRIAALDMRRQGATYRQIAAALGLANPGNAHRMIREELNALREQCRESVAELRELELERLDLLWRALMPAVAKGDTRAVLACVALSKRRCALLGLDKPQKLEMGGNRYTVHEASPECPAWEPAPAAFPSA